MEHKQQQYDLLSRSDLNRYPYSASVGFVGSRYLNMRIQSSSQIVMVLAAGIFMPMAIEHSNKRQQTMHLPTLLCTFLTFFCGLSLRGLVGECFCPIPGPRRYVAIKSLVHACALLLVSLSFSLSLMMRMNVVATSATVAAAAAFVAHRLWQCAATGLRDDVDAYRNCEEQLQQLLDLSTSVTSTLFGGWFRDARFVPSEYLTFFTSVAASLMLLKAVRKRARGPQQVTELVALLYALVAGVAATALVIAASKVRGYAALALAPEAVALAAWCARRLDGRPGRRLRLLPLRVQDLLNYSGVHGEPPGHGFVSVSLPLLLGVLTYRAKDIERALSTLYDEAFVLVTAAAALAALGWRLLTQPPMLTRYPEAQAAATVLAFSTYSLLVLSVLTFLGVILGL
ncbi:uncharacterized protein LOC112889116 [Panicum hallii]|uniref:uncharacterized protein LOC112889116 n=1 Tax=Panicum hallii TaxID=206008 RepID=UPI000DF4EFE9|nr:uncharacterized protein LOC112889116 [Panicum hallii]